MILGEPNLFSYLALLLWVPVAALAFARLRPPMATAVTIIGGIMFLPEQVALDAPVLPPIDKLSVSALCALAGCLVKCRGRLAAARPFRGIDLLFVVVILGNVGTVLTNSDPLVTGPVVRQGLTLYDAFAHGGKDLLALYLPFFLARAMLRTPRDLADLMRVLTGAGIAYGVLALFEVRMSPQLHRWIYGFHTMDFSMTMRFGGYRPTVFMLTGLATAMFMLATAIAAWARWRGGKGGIGAPIFLSFALLLCKSTGAIVYGIAVLPIVAMVRRPRARLAAALAILVLLFPLLRGTDVFPTDTLVEWAHSISAERAQSLWFRFDQEDQLLARARERLVFGWGTYDRNRVFDPETGRDLSITDGDWMIQLGTRGLVGFVGLYGVLALSVVLAHRRLRAFTRQGDRVLFAGLVLISALQTVDLLPNGLFHSLPFFFAGAVYGIAHGAPKRARARSVGAPCPAEGRARAR